MYILDNTNSVANQFLAGLRDQAVHNDQEKFRLNMKKLGALLAYEISKSFHYQPKSISTPLAETKVELPNEDLVIISILRAALPFAEGFRDMFPNADFGFIGAARREGADIKVDLDYLASPSLESKTVIVVDPMLATGKSLKKSLDALISNGRPKEIHLASVIAAPEGVAYLQNNLSIECNFWTCSLDERLNEQSYIVPGLGDAGDLAFGTKL